MTGSHVEIGEIHLVGQLAGGGAAADLDAPRVVARRKHHSRQRVPRHGRAAGRLRNSRGAASGRRGAARLGDLEDDRRRRVGERADSAT